MGIEQFNSELKKILQRVKNAHEQIQGLLKEQSWVDGAKKYAERQGNEAKKVIRSDFKKLKAFVNKEKKELEKLQAQIPSEVKKIKDFVKSQKKELKALLRGAKVRTERKVKKVKKKLVGGANGEKSSSISSSQKALSKTKSRSKKSGS